MKSIQKEFKYKDIDIKYMIIKNRIKNVYIHIKSGQIIVKSPIYVSDKKIEELVNKKSEWIYKKLKEYEKRENRDTNILENKHIYILGNKIQVNFIMNKAKNIEVEMNEKICNVIIPENINIVNYKIIQRKIEQKQKEIAIFYIKKIMNEMINKTKLLPSKIEVRKFKSIWGSCSSKKVIKINQNIIWYSKDEIRYVCLHELCHLKYMNHQKEFWNLVEKYMPEYKKSVKILKGCLS